MAHSKEQEINQTVPGKDLMADLLDKDFNTTILNMPKEIRCGKSQENDV